MRVRIRRFGWLRVTSKFRHSHSVVGTRGQSGVQQLGGILPPTSRVRRHLPGRVLIGSEAAHFPVDGRPSLPRLELNHPQPVAKPFVHMAEDPRRLG